MKIKKQRKQGVSLIVLVITIIVMIILAATVIISLTNNGIIGKANEAVNKTDLKQMQLVAQTLWADAYLEYKSGEIAEIEVIQKVKEGLHNVDENYLEKYNIKFYQTGVELSLPEWKTLYTDLELQDGMAVLGDSNIFNTTDLFRLTIQSEKFTGTIETKLLGAQVEGEKMYLFCGIENNQVIYFNSIEEYEQKFEESSDLITVAGMYVEEANMCVIGFEGDIGEVEITKLEVLERYIDEGWDVAYTYTNGVWSNTPIQRGKEAKGDIVAKFYKTGDVLKEVVVTLPLDIVEVPDSNAYYCVIEGTGAMGDFDGLDMSNAWDRTFAQWYIDLNENGTTTKKTGVLPYITEAVIKEGVTNIGAAVFMSCSSLKKVTIPNSVTNIGIGAFWLCNSLTSITIPNSVISIPERAFQFCKNLKNVTIPSSVTNVGLCAFVYCESLTTINYLGTIEQWQAVEKGTSWNDSTGDYTIYCTNGRVAKDGTVTYN